MVRVLVALLMSLGTSAASAMDLMDLYDEARVNDARYAAARAQFRAMQERVPQARAGVVPNANLDGAYKRYKYQNEGGLPHYSFGRSHRYGGELLQPAYR